MTIAGVAVTGLEGSYCPIPAPHILELRLSNRRYVFTELGLEMQCNTCGEYYPADTEEEYRMYDDPLARLRSEAEQRARGHLKLMSPWGFGK